jgi:hypothetical protein
MEIRKLKSYFGCHYYSVTSKCISLSVEASQFFRIYRNKNYGNKKLIIMFGETGNKLKTSIGKGLMCLKTSQQHVQGICMKRTIQESIIKLMNMLTLIGIKLKLNKLGH